MAGSDRIHGVGQIASAGGLTGPFDWLLVFGGSNVTLDIVNANITGTKTGLVLAPGQYFLPCDSIANVTGGKILAFGR